MTPEHLEGIKARLRAKLDATMEGIHARLAGQENAILYRHGAAPLSDHEREKLIPPAPDRTPRNSWLSDSGQGYTEPFTVFRIKGETEHRVMAWHSDPAEPFLGLPDTMTIGEGLHLLAAEADHLVAATQRDLVTLAHLVPAPLRKAVLAREELIARWPWPRDSHPVGFTLELLSSAATPRPAQTFVLGEAALGAPTMDTWPPDVAPLDVATWPAFVKRYPHDAKELRALVEAGDVSARGAVRWVGVATMFASLRAVERDRRRHAMAIDAGRPHHNLLMGVRDLPKDSRTPHTVHATTDRIELLDPDGGCVQLTLALGESAPSEALISALRTLRTWRGLRHWAAVQKLLSVDGGRQGWVRWTLDGHLDAMGVSVKNRTTAAVRAEVARQVEAFTRIEIAVYADDGTLRSRRPILLVGEKYDRLTGSEWALDGMQLTINPLLYGGVREAGGQLGSNWHPAPVELAAVNEREHPYTLALGLILPIRWRLALAEGHDHLTLTGENALRLAGIDVRPHDRQWMRRNGAHAWDSLERDLAELARIGGLGRWAWDATDTPRTLDGRLHLWPAPWMADRTLHEVRPVELPPGPPVLTGAELKAWRARKGLTQAQAAKTLNSSRPTIARAEARPLEPLSTALTGKLREARAAG